MTCSQPDSVFIVVDFCEYVYTFFIYLFHLGTAGQFYYVIVSCCKTSARGFKMTGKLWIMNFCCDLSEVFSMLHFIIIYVLSQSTLVHMGTCHNVVIYLHSSTPPHCMLLFSFLIALSRWYKFDLGVLSLLFNFCMCFMWLE